MGNKNSEKDEFKRLLVELGDLHKHLESSINHLNSEIKKREVEIELLKSERDLEVQKGQLDLVRSKFQPSDQYFSNKHPHQHSQKPLNDTKPKESEPSSEFLSQVGHLLNSITKTTTEISTLIKL